LRVEDRLRHGRHCSGHDDYSDAQNANATHQGLSLLRIALKNGSARMRIPAPPSYAIPDNRVDFVIGTRSIPLVGRRRARCVFQIGVIETLFAMGITPAMCLGVPGGAWNAAAAAVGNWQKLRAYWRCFCRMPSFDIRNL
jgi:hypothetical protein